MVQQISKKETWADTRPNAAYKGLTREAFRHLEMLSQLSALGREREKEWFAANIAADETLITKPMRDLVSALSFAFETMGIPLQGDPSTCIVRRSHGRRPHRVGARYRSTAMAIMTSNGDRNGPGSLLIEIGWEVARIVLGFHGLVRAEIEAFELKVSQEPERWREIVVGLQTAGMRAGDTTFSAWSNLQIAVGPEIYVAVPSRVFAHPAITGWIVDQARFATPLLAFGLEAVGRPAYRRRYSTALNMHRT